MANNDTSDVSCVDKELSPEDRIKIQHEFANSHQLSLVEPPFVPAPSQEHTSDMSESVSSSNGDGNGSVSSSDDSDSAPEQPDQNCGEPTAKIMIGTYNFVLELPAQLLGKKFPYFAKRLNSSRLSFYMGFSELDPAGFKLLKRWIYGASIAEQKSNKCRTYELFALYAIAYTFEHQSLQDEAMDCIIKEIYESRDDSRFTPEHVRFAYELTPETSELRFFSAGLVAEAMKEDNQFNWDDEQISTLLDAIPELFVDISPHLTHRFKKASKDDSKTAPAGQL
ncbi:hypothetical protein BELL_0881g00020 [Botrytis elliptica]|uniref:BTB domain-containing protein n=1 Tax=Botrytis elliptica TaxID=278938 RepID=A0A4Z1J1Z1_9HELO|nr:hypothetical protein EAE99_009413 [Botrytis elliptica]TGO67601.1 hypothetical protein BELL_0881g00020 [Botrytis elliptica]